MSTVHEVITARHAGVAVLGPVAGREPGGGRQPGPLRHEDVTRAANAGADAMGQADRRDRGGAAVVITPAQRKRLVARARAVRLRAHAPTPATASAPPCSTSAGACTRLQRRERVLRPDHLRRAQRGRRARSRRARSTSAPSPWSPATAPARAARAGRCSPSWARPPPRCCSRRRPATRHPRAGRAAPGRVLAVDVRDGEHDRDRPPHRSRRSGRVRARGLRGGATPPPRTAPAPHASRPPPTRSRRRGRRTPTRTSPTTTSARRRSRRRR
jgi:hypothetical protein